MSLWINNKNKRGSITGVYLISSFLPLKCQAFLLIMFECFSKDIRKKFNKYFKSFEHFSKYSLIELSISSFTKEINALRDFYSSYLILKTANALFKNVFAFALFSKPYIFVILVSRRRGKK